MSALKMLKPSDGKAGVVNFVTDTVINAGGNPCPPVIVGVGVGGTFEQAALLAKKALLRKVNTPNENAEYAELEQEILSRIQVAAPPKGSISVGWLCVSFLNIKSQSSGSPFTFAVT